MNRTFIYAAVALAITTTIYVILGTPEKNFSSDGINSAQQRLLDVERKNSNQMETKMLTIFKSKGEKHFVKYLKHTEPLSGEVQDPVLAREHLQKAVDLKHADATFVMGALIYTGDGYPRSEPDGYQMMVEAKKLGASEIADQISEALGIDLSRAPTGVKNSEAVEISEAREGAKLSVECSKILTNMHERGEITFQQMHDALEVVRSIEPIHLANVLGILSNPVETKKFIRNAPHITGWDAENATFFVSEMSENESNWDFTDPSTMLAMQIFSELSPEARRVLLNDPSILAK